VILVVTGGCAGVADGRERPTAIISIMDLRRLELKTERGREVELNEPDSNRVRDLDRVIRGYEDAIDWMMKRSEG